MLREIISNELFTVLLVIGLTFVAIAKLTNPQRFDDFIYVIGNSKYLKIYSKDQKFFDKFDGLLFCNLIICSSVFGYAMFRYFSLGTDVSPHLLFKFAAGIGSIILSKVLLERLLASLFEFDAVMDDYQFQKISYKNYLGLLLLPINAIVLYNVQLSLPIIYGIIIFLLIINIIGVFTSFKSHQSFIKQHFFYFILYLCALEIAPYVILYKVFLT